MVASAEDHAAAEEETSACATFTTDTDNEVTAADVAPVDAADVEDRAGVLVDVADAADRADVAADVADPADDPASEEAAPL